MHNQTNETTPIEGFILINKPAGLTSFQCVSRIKRLIGKGARVGHSGTLDCFATGLLIVAISRKATREIDKIMKLDKWYLAQAKLGELTDSLDINGALIEEKSVEITREQLEQAIRSFGTGYEQIPPLYSALKHQGKNLSDLARRGSMSAEQLTSITAEKKRFINLYSVELQEFAPPFFTILAHVSHGTYIRSLMNDIAQRVGTVATTHELQRTIIGPFKVSDACDLYEIDSREKLEEKLISCDVILAQISKYKDPSPYHE